MELPGMDCDVDETKCKNINPSEHNLHIKTDILEYLSTNENVFVKTVSEGLALSKEQKIEVIQELLERSYSLFLAKFGNHLLKEHLSYFENVDGEESVIVKEYLKHLNKKHTQTNQTKNKKTCVNQASCSDEMEIASGMESFLESEQSKLCTDILDHLSLSEEAYFRSQQVGEPDLLPQEKKDIAASVLEKSPSQFLNRFGTHLLEEHLSYFDRISDLDGDEAYEIKYHLKQLRKTHCKAVTPVGIKNRRFEALKKMVEEGSYFCESEMRNRNPLLYEQLVGKFLSPEERRDRLNDIDTANITFVNLLLEQMDRENVRKLKKEQEDAEDDAMEEEDTSSEEMEEESDSEEDNDLDKSLWGEAYTDGDFNRASSSKPTNPKREEKKHKIRLKEDDLPDPSDSEKRLLLEEFRTSMFSSFLQGKDTNFDYSKVDYNSDYDDLEAEGQDAEEKYFDDESSENENCENKSDVGDELEQYMRQLRPEPTSQELSDKLQSLET